MAELVHVIRRTSGSPMMRQVLIIHYHFLPVHNVAVKRLLGYARQLPEFGWRPLVLTREWQHVGEADPSWGLSWEPGLEKDAGIAIHRVPWSPPQRTCASAAPAVGGKMRRKVARLARMAFGKYPDDLTGWVRPAVASGARLGRRDRIDAIVSYCPPETNALVARRLARLLAVPWVPFFGDLYGFFVSRLPTLSVEGWLRRAYHRWVLGPAAACAAVSPYMVAYLARTYGKRAELVLTGFDPDEFVAPGRGAGAAGTRLIVSHVGSVYPGDQRPEVFFDGLDALLRAHPDVASELDVRFIGSKCDAELRAMIEGRPSARVCTIHPKVDSKTAVSMVRASDVLLAFTCSADRDGHGTMSYPTKIFEAFGARRPVLAVPADGDWVDALLARTNGGTSARDAGEVAHALWQWLSTWRRDGRLEYGGRPAELAALTRRAQVERLSALLDSVCR